MQTQLAPRPRTTARRHLSVLDLIEWAFQREKVSLDFDAHAAPDNRPGVGTEWLLMQRKLLGTQIDGGGRSDPHPDAEAVASALAVLPDHLGGVRMALRIAEMARAGQRPDAGLGLSARVEPRAWRRCKHGVFAERVFWDGPGRWPVTQVSGDWGFACPVRITGTEAEVARRRALWTQWRGALESLRFALSRQGALTCHVLTDDLPPRAPWQKGA